MPTHQSESTIRPSATGAGPLIGLLTFVYFVVVVIIDHFAGDRLAFDPAWRVVTRGLGLGLIVTGIVAYLLTVRKIRSARRDGLLVTTGIFSWLRHPLYAIGIWLLTPGVCLLFHSWLVLTTAPVMYLAYRLTIHREEEQLVAAFGDRYRRYRERVGGVIPWKRAGDSGR